MARGSNSNGSNGSREPLISELRVKGLKSIDAEQRLEMSPLTVLAGTNSSGKSSMMQSALLIKQTLESPYDPGPLRIDGPNVRMTEFNQLFWGTGTNRLADSVEIAFTGKVIGLKMTFAENGRDLNLTKLVTGQSPRERVLRPKMSQEELRKLVPPATKDALSVVRDRCFLRLRLDHTFDRGSGYFHVADLAVDAVRRFVRNLIHVPGLRPRTAERLYPRTAVGDAFPGTFDDYFASVLHDWKRKKSDQIENVGRDLEEIGLTWKVDVEEVGDTALTILVGRLPSRPSRGGTRDLVNLADVGIGVSQALPVVVALRAAKPGDTVYTEQPEVHLHPRAQVRMAGVLADAVKRGVRVIVETHSSLLLLGIQALVAERKLSPGLVKLHWFQRDKRGATSVASADLDKNGAFGDWPEDFADVSLKAQSDYLDAVETRSSSR